MMNRRDLFKGLIVGAAGLMVPSTTSYFLAPPGGWRDRLIVRRVQQYIIHNDSAPYRYDASWVLPSGEEKQYYVLFEELDDNLARQYLERRARDDRAFPNAPNHRLALPRGVMDVAYI